MTAYLSSGMVISWHFFSQCCILKLFFVGFRTFWDACCYMHLITMLFDRLSLSYSLIELANVILWSFCLNANFVLSRFIQIRSPRGGVPQTLQGWKVGCWLILRTKHWIEDVRMHWIEGVRMLSREFLSAFSFACRVRWAVVNWAQQMLGESREWS
jgi:hypothetical protein